MDRPIGIFDSGVGGLSILLEIKKLLPCESIVYLADQASHPYGTKSESEIKEIAARAVSFLLKRNSKIVIVACNTATVHTIDYLRSKFDVPIIGTVPVVKTISGKTKSGKIAVFSTPATAKSAYLKKLIKDFASDKKVTVVGESGLETLVEEGIFAGPRIDNIIQKHLNHLVSQGVDSIALGCTHYSFLKGKIQKIAGSKAKIFDSNLAIAKQTKRILTNNHSLGSAKSAEYEFFTSGDPENFRRIAEKLLNQKLAVALRAEL